MEHIALQGTAGSFYFNHGPPPFNIEFYYTLMIDKYFSIKMSFSGVIMGF
jgi:hypothetical protein